MNNKRALVVDDSPATRKLHTIMLEKLGFNVESVNNGLQALNASAISPFDLILMDCEMPVMNGPVAAAALRGMGIDSTIIGISSSGMGKECLLAGMNAFLEKPLSISTLVQNLSKLVVA